MYKTWPGYVYVNYSAASAIVHPTEQGPKSPHNRTRAQVPAQPNKCPSPKCLIRCPRSPVDRSGVQIVPSDDMAPMDTCMQCGMCDATCLTMGTVSVCPHLFSIMDLGPCSIGSFIYNNIYI